MGIAISMTAALTVLIILIQNSQPNLLANISMFMYVKFHQNRSFINMKKKMNYNFSVSKAFQCTKHMVVH